MVVSSLLLSALLSTPVPCAPFPPQEPAREDGVTDELLTEAERSGFRKTATHAQVVALLDALAASSELASRASMGATFEGRDIPLLLIADPPVGDVAAVRAAAERGKVVVLAFADIHAGEVCGKEALPILARELLAAPDAPDHRAWLDRLVLVLAPIFNGDGNERFAADNRPGQIGPDEMGQRPNAQGLDLNRDYMKLESPEVRAMVAALTAYDPDLVIDLHTTNGSLHRYDLTWSPPLNPAGPVEPLVLVRDRLLPDVARALKADRGIHTFPYGNFDADKTRWETYSSLPRFGAQYHGLRGHLSILSEAYSKVPFARRIEATRWFVHEILDWTARHADEVRAAFTFGRRQVIDRGRFDGTRDRVGIRHELAPSFFPTRLEGWVESVDEEGHAVATDRAQDYIVEHYDHFGPTLTVERPLGYLVPADMTVLLDVLTRHGIAHHALAAGAELGVEIYRLDEVTSGGTAYLGHGTPDVKASPRSERVSPAPGGWVLVPTGQPLGTLVVHLLEPEAEDALAPVLLGPALAVGEDYPVWRVVEAPPSVLGPGRG